LENLALVQDGYLANDQHLNEQAAQITLMSLHSAKGLEFDIVFMVGMEEGLLPHSRSLMSERETEEERRLCYVGITRARKKLYLSYARSRFTYGYSSQSLPSRFLSEIDQKLLRFHRQFGETNQASSHRFNSGNFNNSDHKKSTSPPTSPKRHLVIDDDSLEALLNDELDIKTFLRS
jgi:DNA helicase-2/ATP-dependent DNA helicase PcrA